MNKNIIILVLCVVLLVSNVMVVGRYLVITLRSKDVAAQKDVEVVQVANDVNMEKLEKVNELDEKVVGRYQESVEACRTATSAIFDKDFEKALVNSDTIGRTEQDINPLLRERKELMMSMSASLL